MPCKSANAAGSSETNKWESFRFKRKSSDCVETKMCDKNRSWSSNYLPGKKKKPLDTSFQAPFTCLETFTLKTKARVKLRTSSHRPNLIKVWVDLQYKVRIAWVKRPNAIQPNFGGKKTSRDVWALARWIYVWKSYFELRSEASGSRSHSSQCHLREKFKLNLNSAILISSRKRKVWMGFET